jgi:hypothetical protein
MKKLISILTIALVAGLIFSACKNEDDRDDYVGSYRTNYEYTQNGQILAGTYTLTITKSATNVNDIILANINNSNESVRATVSGNAMTIPQQTIQQMGISGSGTLNGNVLNFSTQQVETGGVPINIVQIATKQ